MENKWIPCAEQLPKIIEGRRSSDRILICYSDGVTVCGDYVKTKVADGFRPSRGKAVAWMPIPEPYKEEIND